MFGALRRASKALRLKVLGDCGGQYVPSAAPATAEALRAAPAAPLPEGAPADRPAVFVVCLPTALEGGGEAAGEAEAALIEAVAAAAAAASPRHLLVHMLRPATGGEEAARRRLLAAGATTATLARRSDRANQTSNYTNCDPLCQKHVRPPAGRGGAGLWVGGRRCGWRCSRGPRVCASPAANHPPCLPCFLPR